MARMLWVTCARSTGEPLVRVASRVHVLLPLLQPRCHLGEAPWAALLRLLVGVMEVARAPA